MDDITAIIITILVLGGTCLLIYKIIKGILNFIKKGLKKAHHEPPITTAEKATPIQKSKEINAPNNRTVTNVISAIIFIAMIWYFFGGGLEKQANSNLKDIQNQVATDSVAQYGISSRNGSAMDRCVQAGLVSASFLQAQNEANYQKWKEIERNDCARAGIAR